MTLLLWMIDLLKKVDKIDCKVLEANQNLMAKVDLRDQQERERKKVLDLK